MRPAVPFLSVCLLLTGAPSDPELPAPTVVRAPDHSSGPVSPGEIVIIYRSNPGPAVLAGAQLDLSGKVTTSLGDTRALFDGIPAPLAYTVTGEVMAIVPYEIADRKTTQVVVEHQGRRSPPVTLNVVSATPALYTLDSTGHGQAAMLNATGCCNSSRNPAKRGTIAVLYATGEGQTSPPGITGGVSFFDRIADYPAPRLPVRVTVGGQPAEIIYAAEAPHAVTGLLQVNFRVPPNAPIGDAVPLTLTVGAFRSPDGVTMAVRPAVQRVLVVDPDPANRDRLGAILAAGHYYVSTAASAHDAIQQAVANLYPVDLVIFSLAIAEPERIEAVHAMLAHLPQLKIIATSPASALDPSTLRAADLIGAQAIFTRSVAASALLQRVRDLLQDHPTPYTALR